MPGRPTSVRYRGVVQMRTDVERTYTRPSLFLTVHHMAFLRPFSTPAAPDPCRREYSLSPRWRYSIVEQPR